MGERRWAPRPRPRSLASSRGGNFDIDRSSGAAEQAATSNPFTTENEAPSDESGGRVTRKESAPPITGWSEDQCGQPGATAKSLSGSKIRSRRSCSSRILSLQKSRKIRLTCVPVTLVASPICSCVKGKCISSIAGAGHFGVNPGCFVEKTLIGAAVPTGSSSLLGVFALPHELMADGDRR